jgi:UDP-N-acetylmuramoyl-L-alanyl-D-glutamate--2,6-diaminopimelate ligase
VVAVPVLVAPKAEAQTPGRGRNEVSGLFTIGAMGRGTGTAPASATATGNALAATAARPPLPPPPYLVVGLARAGTAAGRALATHVGPGSVRAWDSLADASQRERARALRRLGIDVLLGGDGVERLEGVRTVVKSPGVPWEIPVIAEAGRRGLPIVDELEIGWRLLPVPTVAVTGTNGKSTVASLCLSILERHGLRPELSGNTDFGPPLSELGLGPAPGSVVAEVSSYQAEASPELAVDGAAFTNLTPDHLNRHRTMEAYGAAKRALFVHGDRTVPVAALNVDDELGRAIADEVEERGGSALRYGRSEDAGHRIVASRSGLREAEVELETPEGPLTLATRLPGAHNAANVTAALALADGLGLPRGPTVSAIAETASVRGRFEAVDVGRPFDVVVDLAYSPDSVKVALAAARELVRPRDGRVVAVLGVIGRAGPSTGRIVGRLAREGSDHLILCGTSYRGEPRMVTLAELVKGARDADGGSLEVVIDRRQAIARAMAAARPGDLVAILGRGHIILEATDARGGFRPLDDRQVAMELA